MSATMAAWAATFLVDSTIVLGVVLVASVFVRARPRYEEFLWRAAVIVALVAPTLQLGMGAAPRFAGPDDDVAVVTGGTLAPGMAVGGVSGDRAGFGIDAASRTAAGAAVHVTGSTGREGLDVPVSAALLRGAVWLWWMGAIVVLGLSVIAHRRFLRSIAPRVRTDAGDVARMHGDVAGRFRVAPMPALTRSSALRTPITISRREICLPDGFETLPIAERRALLAHEMAHVERADAEWRRAMEIVCALLFFQPLMRMARRRQNHLAEVLADRRALAATGEPAALASALREVARWIRISPATAVPAVSRESDLVRRVRLILSELPVELHGPSRVARIATVCIATITLVAAIPAVVPVNAEPDRQLPRVVEHPAPDALSLPVWRIGDRLLRIDAAAGKAGVFGRIAGAARAAGERVVVLDETSKELRIFNEQGVHTTTVSARGEPPAEFIAPMGLQILGDGTIQVEDQLTRMRFATDGSLLDRATVDWGPVREIGEYYLECPGSPHFLDDDIIACRSAIIEDSTSGDRRGTMFFRIPLDLAHIDTLGTFPAGPRAFSAPPWYALSRRPTAFAGTPARVYASNPDDYEIDVRDMSGRQMLIIRRENGRRAGHPVLQDLRYGDLARLVQTGEVELHPGAWIRLGTSLGVLDTMRSTTMADTDSVSIVSGIDIDVAGNIWVAVRETDTTDDVLHDVFDAQGRYLARARIPAQLRVLWIGEREIIAEHRTGRERAIEVYPIVIER